MKTYIIYCVPAQIPYLGFFIPQIWAKMFSANQIAGFFNQPYLQNKLVNGQKWVWPIRSLDPEIDFISRMN